MKTPGKKTSKKVSLPQARPSGKAPMHWHAPNINYPKQTRFCQTKEDFHEEYGLSLEGENPRHFSDADVPENQWLTVFTHKRLNKEKVHLKLVRPEFFEECALLYHMVYQRIPPNNEITVKFARGFAFDRCRSVQSPTKKAKHRVAWAVFAEGVIKNVILRKKLLTKIALWRAKNDVNTIANDVNTISNDVNTISASPIRQHSLDTPLGGRPSWSGHPCNQYDMAHFMQPAYLVHVESAAGMVSAAKNKVQEKKKLVLDCLASIDEAKTKRDKAKGVRAAADALLQKISRAKEELQGLEGESSVRDEVLIWRLKAEIMGCQVALDLLGQDVQSSNLDKAVDEFQEHHNRLLKEVEEADAQSCFVNDLVKQVEKRQVPALALAPPAVRPSVKGTLVIQDECVACGLSIEDSDLVGIYMLPCRHPYHPICFATMCHTREDCVQIGCKQIIPNAAKKMVLGRPQVLLEQSLLPVDAPSVTQVAMHQVETPLPTIYGYGSQHKRLKGKTRSPGIEDKEEAVFKKHKNMLSTNTPT
eukprot:c20297_g2_i1 orf=210-1802(-)